MSDQYSDELERFLEAQRGIFETALAELVAGRKRSHWIWFVFPQVRGLGFSEQSIKYGIRDLDEARAYLHHPILGPRLAQAVHALMDNVAHPREVLGELDYKKFISCMTLFMLASSPDSLFAQTLQALDEVDNRTREILSRS